MLYGNFFVLYENIMPKLHKNNYFIIINQLTNKFKHWTKMLKNPGLKKKLLAILWAEWADLFIFIFFSSFYSSNSVSDQMPSLVKKDPYCRRWFKLSPTQVKRMFRIEEDSTISHQAHGDDWWPRTVKRDSYIFLVVNGYSNWSGLLNSGRLPIRPWRILSLLSELLTRFKFLAFFSNLFLSFLFQ